MRAIPFKALAPLALIGLLTTGCGQGLLGGGEDWNGSTAPSSGA